MSVNQRRLPKPEQDEVTEVNWIGQSVRRLEDERLVRGAGVFVDDLNSADCLHLEFLRSPFAGGQIEHIDTSVAASGRGVVAILTAADLRRMGKAAVNPVLPGLRECSFELLARRAVKAVGQPVAAIIAETRADALDALGRIDFGVCGRDRQAHADDVFSHHWTAGDVDAAFAGAAFIAKAEIHHARVAPCPLEPRAALAMWNRRLQKLTAWLSTQTPHLARDDLARILGLSPEQIRVVAPDVGGAFGGKASIYPEDVMVAYVAMRFGRPVKWCAIRSEDFAAATHGRGATSEAELALTADARIVGLRARLTFPVGHWMTYSSAVPARNAGRILPGPYHVGAIDVRVRGESSNTAAVGIYRGAGRPESALLMERLMDEGARLAKLDPVEMRRRNLIAGPFPHRTPTREILDSGSYPVLLNTACRQAGYRELRQSQSRRRTAGEICGLGVAFYIEPCGRGWESAAIRLLSDGRLEIATGSTAQGQGRETAITQIGAEALGVKPEIVVVRHGDTTAVPTGIGSLASRSTAIGGSAVKHAAQVFRNKARRFAAEILDCRSDALASIPEGFAVGGGARRRVSWAALAATEISSPNIGRERELATSVIYHADGEAWSSGCCIAALSIDRDTGVITIDKLVLVDDAGIVINPMMAEGQLLGGITQGIGEALMERVVYDGEGQLMTGSLMDYALPRASDIPAITIGRIETPSPANLLGAKGVGEAGCIGVPAAIANAVMDALENPDLGPLKLPFTSEAIWRAIQQASAKPTTPGSEP